jgi:hypothetical protein
MGYAREQAGSLSAPPAAHLGFLPTHQMLTFHADGRGGFVTLSPTGGRSGMRAVRLVDSLGIEYWVEYRSATGQDAWLGDADANYFRPDQGVLVRTGELMPRHSLLLDATPPVVRWLRLRSRDAADGHRSPGRRRVHPLGEDG